MFTVLSLFVAYLWAVGASVVSWADSRDDTLDCAALSLGLGLLLNFWLMLTGQPFAVVFAVGALLAAIGIWAVVRRNRRRPTGAFRARLATVGLPVVIACVLVVHYFRILSEPLTAWDARSVWFFHARKIWLDGALLRAGWDHPSLVFSNPDYPKLVAAMAAQLGYLRGFWNEYFPKGSLFITLVPAVLWTFSFRKWSASFVLLVAMFFFASNEWLSNGYMDGYLFIYSGIALLFAGRFLAEQREFDLHTAFCALGIVCCLKNEGLLFALCVAASTLVVAPFTSVPVGRFLTQLRARPRLLVIPLVSLGPAITWTFYKAAWGLQNPLTREPAGVWTRLVGRLSDGSSTRYIAEFLIVNANGLWVSAALAAVGVAFVYRQRGRVHSGAAVAAVTAVFHFCGMFVVYLSTPADLVFHMTTSAFRTMASTRIAFMVCLFFVLSDLEGRPESSAPVNDSNRRAGAPVGAGDAGSPVLS